MMSPFPRHWRWLLRAYPRSQRRHQGDEILTTVADGLPPGTRRLPFLVAIDLVLGGLRCRHERRPPFLDWLRYRAGGGRLEQRYHAWLLDDLVRPHPVRSLVVRVSGWAALGLGVRLATQGSDIGLPFLLINAALAGQSLRLTRSGRGRELARHGYSIDAVHRPGVWVGRVPVGPLLPNYAMGRSLAAVGWALMLAGPLAVAAAHWRRSWSLDVGPLHLRSVDSVEPVYFPLLLGFGAVSAPVIVLAAVWAARDRAVGRRLIRHQEKVSTWASDRTRILGWSLLALLIQQLLLTSLGVVDSGLVGLLVLLAPIGAALLISRRIVGRGRETVGLWEVFPWLGPWTAQRLMQWVQVPVGPPAPQQAPEPPMTWRYPRPRKIRR